MELTTWMGDCLRTGKPSQNIINTKVNSTFHPSGVGKSSMGLSGLAEARRVKWQITLWDPTWQVTLRSSDMDFPHTRPLTLRRRHYTVNHLRLVATCLLCGRPSRPRYGSCPAVGPSVSYKLLTGNQKDA